MRASRSLGAGRARRHLLRALVPLGLALAPCHSACTGRAATVASSPRAAPEERTIAERVFSSATGLGPGWLDWGWAPREAKPGGPARLDLSSRGGWILARPGLKGTFGELVFRLREPAGFGEFLVVHLDSNFLSFPHVKVTSAHRRDLTERWVEVAVPMSELNPRGAAFDRIVLRAESQVSSERVEIDDVALTRGTAVTAVAPLLTGGPSRPALFKLDCNAPSEAISPLIYGIAWKPGHDQYDRHQWLLGAGARRLGGNPTSRYNWRLGNAWNTAGDWFFRNVDYTGDPTWTYERFLADNRKHGLASVLTLPLLGWVAKDTSSYSFPVSVFGAQRNVAPELPDAGNGVGLDGKPLPPGPPSRTSVPWTPEDVGEWVSRIRERARSGAPAVEIFILDNEPMLWNTTHRDVHPAPTSYDELLAKTIAYASAVRKADPEAVIAGPALWGWPAYLYSAVDSERGFWLSPDRRAHGNQPLLPWWLAKTREHQARTGVRLIDVVDVHFYPQGAGIAGGSAATDPETCARRIRSTRGLWDPSYRDESWIEEPIELLPRLKRWVAENHPGLGIQIGEYNFGAAEHISGGLAQAEALGRFASGGVKAAFYWTYPPENSPAFWAFRAYRNFDGQGGRFLDRTLDVSGSAPLASLFASRSDEGQRAVAILLNHDPNLALDLTLESGTCEAVEARRVFTHVGSESGFSPLPLGAPHAESLRQIVPPYSITVFDLTLRRGDPSSSASGARPVSP